MQKPGYYECPRYEVADLVSTGSQRILDVGCGAGVLGGFLKDRQGAEVWGVECCAEAAATAAEKLDRVFSGAIEEHLESLPDAFFDTIVCADVLEHLVDPWKVLAELREKLTPGGELVASIPNIRHWSILWCLLEGSWKYGDAGILDRTHVRFFTKQSIIELFDGADLQLLELYGTRLNVECRPPAELLAALKAAGIDVATLEEESQHYQYLCRAIARSTVQQPGICPESSEEAAPCDRLRSAGSAMLQEAEQAALRGATDRATEIIVSRVLPLDPSWSEPYIRLVRILLKADRVPEALGVLHQVPEEMDPVIRLELEAEALAAAGDDAAAAGLLDELERRAPGNAAGLHLKGLFACRGGDVRQAADCFIRAMAADPAAAAPCAGLGLIRWSEGDREDGARLILRAASLDPGNRRIVGLALEVARTSGRWDALVPLFSEALDRNPDSRVAADALLEALCSSGRTQDARVLSLQMLGRFGVDDSLLERAGHLRTGCPVPPVAATTSPSISLVMIVRNEEQHLPRCLASVLSLADELVVVDTGSEDRTIAVAEAFGARLVHYSWNDDYAAARNAGLDAARGRWILVLDADEALAERDIPLVRRAIGQGTTAAWQVVTRNYTERSESEGWEPNDGRYPREQAAYGWYPSRKVRLFPNLPDIRFRGIVHEMVEQGLREAGVPIHEAEFVIHHYGELDQIAVLERKRRYYRLGKAKLEENPADTVQLAELALQAGELGYAEEALSLWNRLLAHLPGHPEALFNRSHALLSLQRYAEALKDAVEALRQMPGHKESALNLAVAELHCGLLEQASIRVAALHAVHPDWPPLVALRLVCAIVAGDAVAAGACIKQLQAHNHGVETYLAQLAVTLAKAGQMAVSQQITAWISGLKS